MGASLDVVGRLPQAYAAPSCCSLHQGSVTVGITIPPTLSLHVCSRATTLPSTKPGSTASR